MEITPASLDVSRLYPAQILPVFYVDVGGLLIAMLVALALLYKLGWWRARSLPSWLRTDISSLGLSNRFKVLGRVVTKDALAVEPLFHHYKGRWVLHLLVFYGFIGLMVTTTLDAIVNRAANPLPLTSPVKIIGNVTGLMLLIGATPMLFMKKHEIDGAKPLGFSDRVFLPVLYLVTLTGFITEILDFSGVVLSASAIYILHIGLVTALLVSAPWTRFVHALQSPYLSLYERLRQRIDEKSGGEHVDYKRLKLAEYVKTNLYPQYLHKEEQKDKDEKKE